MLSSFFNTWDLVFRGQLDNSSENVYFTGRKWEEKFGVLKGGLWLLNVGRLLGVRVTGAAYL